MTAGPRCAPIQAGAPLDQPTPFARLIGPGGALLWGLLGALIVAGPDLPALRDGLPGYLNNDGVQAIYLHHQLHEALLAGRLDLSDPSAFHPFGISWAPINGMNCLEMLLSGLFRLVLPWPLWLSAAAFAWIPLNCLAFYPLGRRLWGGHVAAWAGGLCWALMPHALHQLAAGRLTQLALVGLPIAVLGLIEMSEGETRGWKVAGLGMALAGAGYWFHLFFLLPVLPLFALEGWRSRGRPYLLDAARGAGLSLALLSPLLGLILWGRLSGGGPADFDHRFMSPVFPDSLQLWGPQPASLQGWLPWVFLPGLLWTLWRGERRLLWLGSALLLLIFALGPAQRWGDRVWLLPGYPLWAWVPGYGRMMHPDRWVSLAGLFLVLGAVDGLARWRAWACLLLPAGLVAQLFLLGNAPLGTWRFHAGQLWQRLAQDGDGAIITVPVMRSAITCAWQPWHGRPTLGGMVEDQPQMLDPDYVRWVESNGLLVDLFQLGQGQDQPLVLYQSELDQLHSAGFDTVLLHQASWAKLREARGLDIEARLSAALGPPWYQDEEGVIWRLPRQGRSGQRPGDREPLQLNGPPGEDPGASGGPRRSAPGGAPPPAGPR